MDSQRCQQCNRPLQAGQLVCECGAVVAATDPGFGMPAIPASNLPVIKLPGMGPPQFDFPALGKVPGPLPGLETHSLGDLKLDFTGGRIAEGRTYRPLSIIGKDREGHNLLVQPFGAALLPDSTIGIVDFGDDAGWVNLIVFNATGDLLRTVCRFEVGDALQELDTPTGLAVDAQGCFYVSDMGSCRIVKVDPTGQFLAALGGEGSADDQTLNPRGIALDRQGNLYVADTGNSRVLKWNPQGKPLFVLGINKPEEDEDWLMSGEEPGEFDEPQGVAVDLQGHILVADTNNHRVQKFDSEGELLFVLGEEGDDAGQMRFPRRVRTDAKGNLYVIDSGGQRIQRFDEKGHFVYQIILPAGQGAAEDFVVDDEGIILAVFRQAALAARIEVM